jgi:hypothetical protein
MLMQQAKVFQPTALHTAHCTLAMDKHLFSNISTSNHDAAVCTHLSVGLAAPCDGYRTYVQSNP